MCLQYQVRLNHGQKDSGSKIFAPRDEDCYIRRPRSPSPTSAPSSFEPRARLSKERRLIRVLEESLHSEWSGVDQRKQMMYDKLQERHKQAMQKVIDDVTRGLAVAC